MIERVVTGLRALASLPAGEIGAPASARARGDLADALRLELDCPQQSLTPRQRRALSHLGDLLDAPAPDPLAMERAVHASCVALALGTPTPEPTA